MKLKTDESKDCVSIEELNQLSSKNTLDQYDDDGEKQLKS